MIHRCLVSLLVSAALLGAACSRYGPVPPAEQSPIPLSFFTLTTQAGKTYFAVSVRLPGDIAYSKARLTMKFPRGAVEAVEPPPEGTSVSRSWNESVEWAISDASGPSILGPFAVLAKDSTVKPEWVKFSWTGGEVSSNYLVQRNAGGASGYGVLRPTATTSRILIGHETEITAYAVGGGIQGEIHVLALKDPVDPPPPDAAVEREVQVAQFSVTVDPDKPYLVGLEMPAPRPLPPLARLRVEKAPLEPLTAAFEPATFAGRVSSEGSRILVPIAGSGRYRAFIDTEEYRAARSRLRFEVLASAQAIRTRLDGAAKASEPKLAPAYYALGEAPALEILARDAPHSSAYANPTTLTETAWVGPLLCSIQACLGTSSKRPVVVCDVTYGNTGCLDTVPGAPEAGLTVGNNAKMGEICASRLCFIPGKALSDNRGVEPAKLDPIVFAQVSDELLAYSGNAIA